jgi:hypothetical protein
MKIPQVIVRRNRHKDVPIHTASAGRYIVSNLSHRGSILSKERKRRRKDYCCSSKGYHQEKKAKM